MIVIEKVDRIEIRIEFPISEVSRVKEIEAFLQEKRLEVREDANALLRWEDDGGPCRD